MEFLEYTVDFSKGFKTLFSQINDLRKRIPIDSTVLLSVYQYLIRLRHDSLVFAILDALNYDWIEEQRLGNEFNFLDIESQAKTPDILFKVKEIYKIIEVSVSKDPSFNMERKKNKIFTYY